MKDWELDFEWLKVRHIVKRLFRRNELPDLNAILFLIGIQELGFVKTAFTKEEKQDLMHLGVCALLSLDGYYKYVGRDADNWPHWEPAKLLKINGVKDQELLLKTKAIEYFNALDNTSGMEEEE